MTSDMADQAKTPVGFAQHDHTQCVEDALATATAYCEEQGLRLTPVRRKVLEFLIKEHRSLGAYAILNLLRKAGFNAQPPVAYRALEFLIKHGFAHKIERLNAYVACVHPTKDHVPTFMICRTCEKVGEAHTGLESTMQVAAQASGFQIERTVIEAEGLCPACAVESD